MPLTSRYWDPVTVSLYLLYFSLSFGCKYDRSGQPTVSSDGCHMAILSMSTEPAMCMMDAVISSKYLRHAAQSRSHRTKPHAARRQTNPKQATDPGYSHVFTTSSIKAHQTELAPDQLRRSE